MSALRESPPPGGPRRIAVVKLSSLGDVVHALPVASALRRRWPDARLSWIVEERESVLLRDHPWIDEVIAVDSRRWRRARGAAALVATGREMRDVLRRLRAARFDVAVDVQGLLKSGVLTGATGAPLRIGFARARLREPLNALFTTRRVDPPPAVRHVVEQCLALLAPLDVGTTRAEFLLPPHAAAEARADAFFAASDLKPRDRLVVLNPGAGREAKRWPVAHFAELARRLVRDAGARVLIVWGPSERESAQAIVGGAATPGLALAPPTDVHALIAILRRASVVVAADTGPLHLAAALGTPCVGLFGPTRAERNGPYGPGHRALQSPDGTMASLSPDAVLSTVCQALE